MIKDSQFDGYCVTDDGKVYSKKTHRFLKQFTKENVKQRADFIGTI